MDHTRRRHVFTPNIVDNVAAEPTTPDYTSRPVAPSDAASPETAPIPSDVDAPQPSPTSLPHHMYTLTVEDVAVKLADHNLYRDPRTIQRWCKTGRLACILDQTSGERYLIEPSSVADMIATVSSEVERQSRPRPDTPRQETRHVETHRDTDATTAEEPLAGNADINKNDATPDPTRRDESRTEPDTDATSKKRISELETKLAIAAAEKQALNALVETMKDHFEQMINGALDRAEQTGELRAENAQLRSLLREGSSTAETSGSPTMGV